ncbi:MAG: putative ATPase/signal transduction histidine kinase [Verrucomicrobiales bacterium]|jgi:predicted ATPase/signal transduction histidine kinase
MQALPKIEGYEITEQVYESPNSVIFRTRRSAGEGSVLKVLKADSPSQKEIVRFHQEYAIAKRIDSPYVAKIFDLIDRDNVVALQVEDIGAQSLSAWIELEQGPLPLLEALEVGISVCRGLAGIHDNRIAHKDISSSNVIWNRTTNQVKIIDFGISSLLDKDLVLPDSPNKLDGNLAYMSPEQTGRMNRPVDFRTDFYSLGVTLYEIFVGRRPFESDDSLELIHAHIAKTPPAPTRVNPAIPEMLGKLVLKLLEKNAENRYQSARGIERDLSEVLAQLREKGSVEDFTLARDDRSDRFLIPSKLYGRETDIDKLVRSFERVRQGEMVLSLVSGYSGVGKSSLVQELYRPLAAARGRYISGKYDQFQRDVPYSALSYALNGFCDQLLAESAGRLQEWKERIQRAAGNNGQVLIEITPKIEDIIGPQPAVPAADPQAAKNRFNQVLLTFLEEICGPEVPLVLFLDDLQWIDQASLGFLKLILLGAKIEGLHLVGAYRDNEVEASHPLTLMLGELDKAGKSYDIVHLGNLTPANLSSLVSDSLVLPKDEVRDLVEIICRKTQGNAFFATEFFKNLHSRGLLSHSDSGWHWDIRKIDDQNITENVVEFMADQLRDFSEETQNVLKFAACIGNEFDLRTLSIILKSDSNIVEILDWVKPAIQTGLIRSENDEYKKVGIVDIDGGTISFKFQHDRVQQAAYSLIPADERPAIHFQIGRLLDEDSKESGDPDERLFEIVSHLNKALPVVDASSERLSIAELNANAGVKARDAAAYQASAEYFAQGRALLPENAFEAHYDLAFRIHLNLAKSLYIIGEFEQSETIYPILLANVTAPMDEVRARMVQMEDYHLQGDYDRAIDVQKKALALLGEDFPASEDALEASIVEELRQTPEYLDGRDIEQLLAAADLDSGETLAKLRILAGMWMSAYLVSRDGIVQWCSIKMTNLSLRFGNSEFAAFAYVQYGYVCSLRLGEFEEGWKYGDLGVRLSERYENVEMRGKVYFNFAIFVNHWTRHVGSSTALFRKGYMYSIEGGDWTYAVYGAANIISNLLIEGKPTPEVAAEGEKYFEFLRSRAEVGLKSFFLPGGYVALLNLLGQTAASNTFDCEHLNEEELLSGLGKLPIVEAWFYSAKLRSLFLYRHLDLAKAVFDKSDIVGEGVPSQIKVGEAYFYSCLIIAGTYRDEADAERQHRMLQCFNRYSKDIESWSKHCPDNFLHKHLLIQAERSRFEGGELTQTLALYDEAIDSAKEFGFINNVALALELKGRFWLELKQGSYAMLDLQEAYRHYENWGVEGKLEQLQTEFPKLARKQIPRTATASAQTGMVSSYQLDLESIYKAAQAISRKVAWNDLIESMLSIVMENVGADRGVLLLCKEEGWFVEADAKADGPVGHTIVDRDRERRLDDFQDCPATVLNYVINGKQPLIVDSRNFSEPFVADPYFHGGDDLSILCAPILSRESLVGMIYLENNLTGGVFTEDRLGILDVLLTQISISLENAGLYEELEQRVQQRTIELARSNEALEASNLELQQFAYVASHDLQSPLRAVSSFSEFLQTKYGAALDEKANTYIDRIVQGCQRMRTLIKDLLEFSRIDSQSRSFAPVALEDVFEDAVSLLEGAIMDSGGTVTRDELPVVNGDVAQLAQILQNLIGNGLKYHGSEPPAVHVSAERADDDGWTIAVRDNGIGIAPEHREGVFEIFRRLHTEKEFPGTGIGLAVCRRIAQRARRADLVGIGGRPGEHVPFHDHVEPDRRIKCFMEKTPSDTLESVGKMHRRARIYFGLFIGLFLAFLLLRGVSWKGSVQLHTLMEVAATLLALGVGIMAILRFYSRRTNTFLFIGTAFLGTAFLDGYHAVVTSSAFSSLFPSGLGSLIPWSWIASRIFLSLLLWFSYLAWRREQQLGEAGKISERLIYTSTGILTLLSFLFFAFVPLPRAYFPELYFPRPEEFAPALFFLLALIGYWRKGLWKEDAFEHWLMLSLIVGFMGQTMFMSFSGEVFDFMFDAAHMLKKVSYILVLTGLLISMFHLYRRADESVTELEARVGERTADLERSEYAAVGLMEEAQAAVKRAEKFNIELKNSNKELDNFAYVASHDLKSPLRAIDNLAQWISEDAGDALPEESRKDLGLLKERVKRMEQLLDSLLQYSRVGRKEGSAESIDVAELVGDLSATLDVPEKFTIRVESELPMVSAPRGALNRVFGNLISNAIKHHDRDDGLIQISSSADDDEFHQFAIADDGPGIAKEFQERIFEMFQTLKSRDEVEGSGMGLAMVKKTLEVHGGGITIESALGEGTTFHFTWPKTNQPETKPK